MLQEVVYLSTLSEYLFCCFFTYLSIWLSVSVCLCLSVCVCLSVSVCLSVYLLCCCWPPCLAAPVCLCLSVCLTVCLCLSVCLSVYLLYCCWPPCLAVPVCQTGSGSVQWPGYHTRTVHSSGHSPVIKSHVVDLTFSQTKKSCFFKINLHSSLY